MSEVKRELDAFFHALEGDPQGGEQSEAMHVLQSTVLPAFGRTP